MKFFKAHGLGKIGEMVNAVLRTVRRWRGRVGITKTANLIGCEHAHLALQALGQLAHAGNAGRAGAAAMQGHQHRRFQTDIDVAGFGAACHDITR